jgi:peptide/nickel transport system permease protein
MLGGYIIRRVLCSLFVLFLVSVSVFTMTRLQPGNPYQNMVTADSDPDFIEKRMREMGYYDPIPLQYLKWIRELFRGNLGYSIKYHIPVTDMLRYRLQNTLVLGGASFLITAVVSVLLGLWSAYRAGGLLDTIVTIASFMVISVPVFFLGLLLIKYFSYELKFLPPSGMITAGKKYSGWLYLKDMLRHMAMPVTALVATHSASTIRYIRDAGIKALSQPHIQMCQARGAGIIRILWKHTFFNALSPIITLLCMHLPALISGAVIIEAVFVWPGVGSMLHEAVLHLDYPVIMGTTVALAAVVVAMNMLADILCLLANPRLRLGGEDFTRD